jgi:hypothetical protein
MRSRARSIALEETLTSFVLPLCSALPHAGASTPISSATTIIDLGGVGLRALLQLRGHLQQASALATANYPETLSATVVLNSPGFFPTIWGWAKVRVSGRSAMPH